MSEDDIKEFAIKHAPALAKGMTELCGKVIAKGLCGVLERCVEMQLRIDALEPASECPDGPRYKALGNSWAVNCARWVGRRIAIVDRIADMPHPLAPVEGS